ncbi:MAG: hypothetical protein AAF125_24635 [Chloroflexota bacterium]
MRELHVMVKRDSYGTFVTNFIEEPPTDEAPAHIFELHGYYVGVYLKDEPPESLLETVVKDAVLRYITGK